MIRIKDLRTYAESLLQRVCAIRSITLVNVDKEMSEALRRMNTSDFPALFVVVPSAEDDSTYPDNVAERSQCLLFLLDRADSQRQRRSQLQILEDTQEPVEALKCILRADAGRPCHFMSGLRNLSTHPETGLYTDYAGWSVSFYIDER